MFINSKAKFDIRFDDGRSYVIPKDFIGEIPEEVAQHWFIQAAIKSGDIAVPAGKSDIQLEEADVKAKAKKKK